MKLLLVQHGKSFSREQDPERGLTTEGSNEAEQIAKQLSRAGVSLDAILHSGKLRAQQTAEIFATALQSSQGIQEIAGINPNDDVQAFATNIPAVETVMVIGHLPFMENLCTLLMTGKSEPVAVKFQNAGVVCLESTAESNWQLHWMIVPDMML